MPYFLGLDAGSVSTKLVVIDDGSNLVLHVTIPTKGDPATAIETAMAAATDVLPCPVDPSVIAITGSARQMACNLLGGGWLKNEITAQAAGALYFFPQARTVIEIGGQDSKIILIENGLVSDFNMNTVCAAGTGSFLDHQSTRLGIDWQQFGQMALSSRHPTRITGRCTVFAESDMIHHQQSGTPLDDIIYGLCLTMAHNYLTGVASGKDISEPVVFQGGLAYNPGIVRALKETLGMELNIPPNPEITGALGAALLLGKTAAIDRAVGGIVLSRTEEDKSRVA